MDEPALKRNAQRAEKPVTVNLSGTAHLNAAAGTATRLTCPNAAKLAHVIAGSDHDPSLCVEFDEHAKPQITFIGDTHIGLQGSLRRTVTLSTSKRPDDETISQVLKAFGLADLLGAPRDLDQRIAENGKGLTANQTLRLDLARAVLGEVDLIVI